MYINVIFADFPNVVFTFVFGNFVSQKEIAVFIFINAECQFTIVLYVYTFRSINVYAKICTMYNEYINCR